VCRSIEAALTAGRYETAAVEGLRKIAGLAARHFPARGRGANELPDKPATL
jgi:uncharacterized membrane protein